MNYYEHHLADYTQATAHLSMLEDAAYSRLLRWYYANEKPLPLDIKQIERLARAQSKQERDAIKVVLNEFFIKQEDGYHQDRADREIGRYQDKQRKASASANARWGKPQTQSEGNANAYANASANASANAMRTQSEGNAHQSPDPSHQTPDIERYLSLSTPSREAEACLAIKAAGIPNVNPQHPDLIALIASGATTRDFANAAPMAIGKGSPFAYLLKIVKNRLENPQPMTDVACSKSTTGETAYQKQMRERVEEVSPRIARQVKKPQQTPQTVVVENQGESHAAPQL